jgi:hypothetical protein
MGFRTMVALSSAALAVAAACSTFDEAPEITQTDAGRDGAGDDGPAQTIDGAPAIDAGSDAWVPCRMRGNLDPAIHFCDDFDRQGAIDYGWDNTASDRDGSFSFFEGGTSLPNAFRSFVPKSNTAPGRAQMFHKTTTPASSYRVDFDVRLDSIPHEAGAGGYSHLVVIEFEDGLCSTGTTKQRAIELSLYANSDHVTLLEKGLQPCPSGDAIAPSTSDSFAVTPEQLVDGKFHHVSITLAKGPCSGGSAPMSVYASVGDLTTRCQELGVDIFADSAWITAYVGAFIGASGYAETAYVYDNVAIDLQ